MALEQSGVELVAQGAGEFVADMARAEAAHDEFIGAVVGADGRLRDANGRFIAVGKGAAEAGETARKGGAGFNAFGEIVTGVLRHVGEIAVDMALQAGKAVAGFVTDSVGIAGDFEAGMYQFGSVTSDAAVEASGGLEKFKSLFLELGAETQFSAAQAQEAAIELAKGGFEPAEIAGGALADTLALAAAGQLDLATAAEITAKQMGVWESTGLQTAQVANLMAQAANASTVDVEELALGMANVGGVAKTAGLDFQETVTTMSLLAPGFSSAADAGTSYKAFLNNLIPTTKPAIDAMIDLGLATEDGKSKFYDAQGAFIGMEAAAELLHNATKGLTEEQKSLALETIFGSDAQRAAALIAENGAAGYNATAAAMNAAGDAAAQAAEKNQGWNFVMESLGGSIETLQIALGSLLLPLLSDLVTNYVTPAVNAFTALVTGSEDAGAQFDSLVAKIDTIIPGFGLFVGFIQSDVLPVFQDIGAWLGQNLPIAGEALRGFWVDTLIPAIQSGYEYFSNNILPILVDLGTMLGEVIPPLVETLATFFTDVLLPALQTQWEFIDAFVVPILQDLAEWLKDNVPPAVKTLTDFLNDQLLPVFKSTHLFVQDNVIPILEGLANVADAVLGLALRTLQKAWEDNEPAIKAVTSAIGTGLKPVIDTISRVISDVTGTIDTWTGGFDGLVGAVKRAVNWLGDLADSIRSLPSLPDVFTPGSPTPAEIGFLGIVRAVSRAKAEFNELTRTLENLDDIDLDVLTGLFDLAASGIRGQLDFEDFIDELLEMGEGESWETMTVMSSIAEQAWEAYDAAKALAAEMSKIDPSLANQFMAERQRQIQEVAELQRELQMTTDPGEYARLQEDLQRVIEAQAYEIASLLAGSGFIDQIAAMFPQLMSGLPTISPGAVGSNTTNNSYSYNYSPSYSSTPNNPSQDFWAMSSWTGGSP